MKTLLILDAHALIHRAYHALPPLTSPDGRVVNAVYGFTSVLIKVLRDLSPEYVVAAFDLAESTFRHDAFAEYKATRAKTEEDLAQQFPVVRKVIEAFGIPIIEHPSFEADDIIGTIVEETKNEKDLRVVIATGDRDTMQLVEGERVVVDTLKGGPAAKMTDTIIYNEEEVSKKFGGLDPKQLIDFKGLVGDPSDNIPGVPKIGEKTATSLLQRHKNIEGIYENLEKDEEIKPAVKKSLQENKDQAFFSRELATIRRDAPVAFSLEQASFSFVLTSQIINTLGELGFTSLLKRIQSQPSVEAIQSSPAKTDDGFGEYLKKGIFSQRILDLERSLKPVLRAIENTGVLVDANHLAGISKKMHAELIKIETQAHKLSGEKFNLNSPQEVGRIIFEKLNIGRLRVKKTRTGQYSTAAEELEKYKDAHKIVPLLLRWRELSKLLSTYVDALPKLISPKDGRLHTTFNQLGAATGRLSSENPNLQNIPAKGEYGLEIRKAFVARSGFLILSADYSQIELRIAASLSGDKKMINAFNEGEDIHTRTAAEIFNVDTPNVTKEMRRVAKVLNFGVLYGMGANSFAKAAGIDRERAAEFIYEYQSDFVGLAKFVQELKDRAYADGGAETLWGRKRQLPELSSPNPGMRAAGERMAINMPIQGTAADVIKAAMVEVNKQTEGNADIYMILQVHDELVFEVKKGQEDKWADKIRKTMMGVIDLVVPLEVDIEVGLTWGELEKLT